jgi:hypothetical protein
MSIPRVLLLVAGALSFCLTALAHGQELYGFTIGMSKDDVCRYVKAHDYDMDKRQWGTESPSGTESSCWLTDQCSAFVTKPNDDRGVNLSFGDDCGNIVQSIWTKFASEQYPEFYNRAVRKYGAAKVRTVTLMNGFGARYRCRQAFWRTRTTVIELDELSEYDVTEGKGILILSSRAGEEARKKSMEPTF